MVIQVLHNLRNTRTNERIVVNKNEKCFNLIILRSVLPGSSIGVFAVEPASSSIRIQLNNNNNKIYYSTIFMANRQFALRRENKFGKPYHLTYAS